MLIKLLYFQCFLQSHRHNFIEQELRLKYTEEEDVPDDDYTPPQHDYLPPGLQEHEDSISQV